MNSEDLTRRRLLLTRARENYGKGWELLSFRMKLGELSYLAVQILQSQDDSISAERMRELIDALAKETYEIARGDYDHLQNLR